MLSQYGPIWMNTHFNTVNEITPESAAAIDRIVRAGVPVNNQSVLMRASTIPSKNRPNYAGIAED